MTYKKGFKLKYRYSIYADDFETFSTDTKYYKEHNDTNVYAISSKKVEVTYSFKEKRYILKREDKWKNKLFIFVNINDYINHFAYSNHFGKYQIHYFHNGIKFDFNFILAWLIFEQKQFNFKFNIDDKEEVNEECWTCSLSGNKFKIIKIYLKDKNDKGFITLEFRDSYRLFNFSIKKMSHVLKEIDNIDIPKTDLDVDLMQDTVSKVKDLPQMILDRVGNDSLILAKWLECRLTDGVTFCVGSRIPFSIATNSINWWCNSLINKYGYKSYERNKKKEIVYKELDVLDKKKRENLNMYWLQNQYYKGGISSFIPEFQDKLITETITSFDVNSLYPWACTKELPVGFPKKSKKLIKDYENYFVFVEVEFNHAKQLQRQVPAYLNKAWSIRDSKYASFIKNTHLNYFYEFDLNCKAMWSLDEFNIFNNKNWFKFNFTNIKYWYFNKKAFLKDYMEEIYQIKCTTKDEVIKASAKLKMNSLTGKFGEKPEREQQVLILKDFEINEKFLESKDLLVKNLDDLNKQYNFSKLNTINCININWSNHTYLPVISAITSLGRSKLMSTSLIETDKDKKRRWYYCDTDSGKTNFELDASIVDNKKLGYWKNEGSCNYFKYLRSKVYAGSNDGINFITHTNKDGETTYDWLASSGVPTESIVKATNFKDFDLTTKALVKVVHKTDTKRIVILEDYKAISNLRTK